LINDREDFYPARGGKGFVMMDASLSGGPELGHVDAEPFPQARLAGLGHGDDPAGFPGGDPAALQQRRSQGGASAKSTPSSMSSMSPSPSMSSSMAG
jgi:hypothetical protein